MALYWANVLAIVPTLGQFSWFVGQVAMWHRSIGTQLGVQTYSIASSLTALTMLEHVTLLNNLNIHLHSDKLPNSDPSSTGSQRDKL